MNFIRFFLLLSFIFLVSCGGKKEEVNIIDQTDIKLQMISAFEKGHTALKEGDVLYAAKMFNEAELLYPQSDWAPKAAIMAAYSYYSQDYYVDAKFELERYLKVYPLSDNHDYAHFLLAMCSYEEIVDEKKDLEPLLNAKKKFEYIIKNYPDTDFALDSSFKIDLILDILAAKEIYIGKHYIKKQKWIAAINRFKNVVDNYATTAHVEEALFRLVEVYYKLGLKDESQKYASVLGYNYQSSRWYEESYRILNPKYVSKREKIDIEKKREKGFLIRKIRGLFD